MTIHEAIQCFCAKSECKHHRYRSWEHCYGYFRRARPAGLAGDRDQAALQLGFYLASWGMYRGSGFLLQHSYTVHLGVVDLISEARFDDLWNADLGTYDDDHRFVPAVLELIGGIRQAYKPYVCTAKTALPSEILITKIILGAFGCLPACDRFFVEGWRSKGFPYSELGPEFAKRVLRFCHEHLGELQQEQTSIESSRGIRYPLMKLVDMYFWQIGYETDTNLTGGKAEINHSDDL